MDRVRKLGNKLGAKIQQLLRLNVRCNPKDQEKYSRLSDKIDKIKRKMGKAGCCLKVHEIVESPDSYEREEEIRTRCVKGSLKLTIVVCITGIKDEEDIIEEGIHIAESACDCSIGEMTQIFSRGSRIESADLASIEDSMKIYRLFNVYPQ